MNTINDYAANPNLALIDAVNNPAFKEFIEDTDIEKIPVDRGDGTQMEVQALSGRTVKRVIEKIIKKARESGADMENWICSPDEFNLCGKLKNTPAGQVMRDLNDFLHSKIVEGGAATAGTLALVGLPGLGWFLGIFSALGFINRVFVEFCRCT